jgi:catechol 2,3-dioxygenase-like lactoylglutathione lyase family enzyme
MTITAVGAVLLISDQAEELATFYREAVGIPLHDEGHDDVPLHYGCDIGGTHFAIHPSAGWPGERSATAQSPVVVFHTDDVNSAHERLVACGIDATTPFDHGFAVVTAFRDPDGNNVELMQLAGSAGPSAS